MKFLLLFTLLISFKLQAKNSLDFELTPDQNLLDKILEPVWEEINYTQVIADKTFYQVLGDTITFQLTKATIVLGQKPMPLFELNFSGKNEAKLKWDFSNLTTNIKAKLRFKFKKYGINVTHDEVFLINGKNLGPSMTKINLDFNQDFKFNLIENRGFELAHVDIKPQNGVGSALRFIFDNIFSKEEVDAYITKQVNIELKKWINKQTLIKDLEKSVNKQLNELRNQSIQISDIANHFKVDITEFDFGPNNFNLALKPKFVYDNLKVHPCAQLMYKPYQKDNVTVSHNIIEQMINNYATYQIVNEGKIQEPLLCFGYKELAQNGDPLGEEAEFTFWGRNIKFKYWVVPTSMPKYSYYPDEQLIKLDLNLLMKIKSKYYPFIKADNDQVKAKLTATYKLDYSPTEGLNLVFQDFDVTSITGRVRVKWNRFTPYVKIPLGLIMNELEVMINEQANDNYKITNLFASEIEFLGGIKLFLDNYEMNEDTHKVIFRTK